MNITLAPEVLFHIGPVQVTNTLFTAFIIFFLIVISFWIIKSKLSVENPSKSQLAFEMLISGLLGLSTDILGEKKGRNLFAFIFTFFIFIFISNIFGLLPFVSTTVLGKTDSTSQISLGNCLSEKDCFATLNGVQKFSSEAHIFRAPTSDLSLTIAFALISVIVTNFLGFKSLGSHYLKKYINFSNPVDAFVGILEIISEIGKVISFSFRLFGNVFAGEILLAVITSITYGVATLPFLGLEVFVGIIQALVFFMLTAVFIGLAAISHSEVDATDAIH